MVFDEVVVLVMLRPQKMLNKGGSTQRQRAELSRFRGVVEVLPRATHTLLVQPKDESPCSIRAPLAHMGL